jgi:hypothetical protein
MKVLVTGVGGPTPRSIAISLKQISSRFQSLELIATDSNPLAIGLYQKHLFSKSYLVPPCGHQDYWARVKQIIEMEQIEIAIVQPELEVIEWSRKAYNDELTCKCLLPHYHIADLLIDKSKLNAHLSSLKVVPDSITFNRNNLSIEQFHETLGDTYWVRSTKGSSGLGSLHVKNKEMLLGWLDMNKDVEDFIASRYLPGRNLATKLLYWKGKLIRSASAERVNYIMSKVAPSGVTGNTSFGRLINEPDLINKGIHIMEHLFKSTDTLANGFYTIDWKEDKNGVPFVTEINIRHVAFTQCFAAAGANFPEICLDLLLDDSKVDLEYKMYEFEKGQVFLRDVDSFPMLLNESELIKY